MSKFTVTETRRQRTTRAGYGASSNRSTLGYWVPLVLTVTAATVGIAAWVWSQRDDEVEEESSSDEHYSGGIPPPGYANMSGGVPPGPQNPQWQTGQPPMAGGFQGPPPPGGFQDNRETVTRSTGVQQSEETGLVARVTNAFGINRAPSPGQAYDWASKGITASVAAAGAVVGGAIGAFSEGNKEGFDDQERWSEEAESREVKQGIKRQGTADEFYSGAVTLPPAVSLPTQKRKTVAIVVSSVETGPDTDDDIGAHASILAHLPSAINMATTQVLVLIYAPSMQIHPLSPAATRRPSQSMSSSFSNISTPAQTPGSFDQDGILNQVDPQPIDETTTSLYKTLHNQAMAIVDRDTMIMPFTSPQGHKHMLKSLQPEIVYMQEGLCGTEGEIVSELSGWVRTTVVVIGDEGGMGGLVDTDTDEDTKQDISKKNGKTSTEWWKREERTGVGRGVSVVEALRIGDDWRRRVNGED